MMAIPSSPTTSPLTEATRHQSSAPLQSSFLLPAMHGQHTRHFCLLRGQAIYTPCNLYSTLDSLFQPRDLALLPPIPIPTHMLKIPRPRDDLLARSEAYGLSSIYISPHPGSTLNCRPNPPRDDDAYQLHLVYL